MPQRKTHRSMKGAELLTKIGNPKKWRRIIDNKMRGTFGETDHATKTIKINKKLHAVKKGGHNIRNKNGTEKLIGTMVHEEMHAHHPRMRERTVRKATRKRVKVMHSKAKNRLYARYRRVQ